jgi:predicted NAD-dependent protein-ADP-ribosyltransferase YbiA (DUF1768 family)
VYANNPLLVIKFTNNEKKDGRYYVFSNDFQEKYLQIKFEGQSYRSAEHAYQAAKFNDEEYKAVIRNAGTPEKARMLGHQQRCDNASVNETIKKFKHVKIKENWNEIRDSVMQSIIDAKFVQNLGPRITLTACGKDCPIVKYCPRLSLGL